MVEQRRTKPRSSVGLCTSTAVTETTRGGATAWCTAWGGPGTWAACPSATWTRAPRRGWRSCWAGPWSRRHVAASTSTSAPHPVLWWKDHPRSCAQNMDGMILCLNASVSLDKTVSYFILLRSAACPVFVRSNLASSCFRWSQLSDCVRSRQSDLRWDCHLPVRGWRGQPGYGHLLVSHQPWWNLRRSSPEGKVISVDSPK